MPIAAVPLERLRRQLRHHLSVEHISEPDLQRLRNRIGRHVVTALHDQQHPLTKQIHEIQALARTLVREEREGSDAMAARAEPSRPAHHVLFMPRPGISPHAIRRLWPTQLLLAVAARSDSRSSLASLLDLSSQRLTSAAMQAAEHSTDRWSTTQHLDYLLQALEQLEEPAVVPVELEGTSLRCGERCVPLTPAELRFFRVLQQHHGTPVSFDTIRQDGEIGDPVKVKHRLMVKAKQAGIPLDITSPAPSMYQLND